MVKIMTYTEKFFIEITTLEKMKRDRIYLVLKKNFPRAFIKIHAVCEIEMRDIHG